MIIKSLQLKRALRSVLLVLLLSAVGMGKMYAQEFTMGNLNYSVNDDGISVSVTGPNFSGEGFENEIPLDWATIDADGDGYGWELASWANHSGNYGVASASYLNGALTPDNYLVSGQISFTANIGIRFYACANDANFAAEHFGVAVSTGSQIDVTNFTTITEWTMSAKSNNLPKGDRGLRDQCSWYEYTVDLSSYAGQIGYVAIRHFNCTDQWYLNVDDVYIGEEYNTSLTLNIPENVFYEGTSYSVTSIGDNAFKNCSFYTGDLILPNSMTSISENAFSGCTGFTGSLNIPNSVTSIGVRAFFDCNGLTSINIPNTINSIEERAFEGTGWYATQPDGILYLSNWCLGNKGEEPTGALSLNGTTRGIAGGAFSGCSGLTGSLVIPNSVVYIGSLAFADCSGFTGSLTIPNSVATIGNSAFYNCSGLTGSLTIPNSVTSIGESAFSSCNGFTGSLTIGNSVTSIGDYAFYNCWGLTGDLVIPNSVTTIGSYAFRICRGLTGSLTIGNSVTTIGDYAFWNCSGFTGSLTIGNSVTTIGSYAFYNCIGLTAVYYTGDVGQWCNISFYDNPLNYAHNLYIDNELVTNLVIPEMVTEIKNYAFQGATCLTSLTIPNSVTTIGNSAFYNCSGLTGSLTIPNSVTTIGGSAFWYCSGLTGSLTIPNSVTTIGGYAFYGCSGLTGSLTIPNSVTTIGGYAFSGCTGFSSVSSLAETPPSLGYYAFSSYYSDKPVYVPCGYEEAYASVSWGGFNDFIGFCGGTVTVMADLEECGTVAGGGQIEANQLCTVTATANEGYVFGNWTFNGTVVSVEAEYTFYVVGDMTLVAHFVQDGNITFADANVKSICVSHWDTNGDCELSYAEAAAVTSLGQVFRESTEITSFEELQYFIGLRNISSYAFYNCSNLSGSLYIPNSVTTIGDYAFYGCSGFTGSLTIPNSVTEIGGSAFNSCSGFTGLLTIGESVQTIGNYAFYNCRNFTGSLTIPNSVTSIGNYAFYDCYSFMGNLTIGNSVTSMGNSAFYNCSGFTAVLYTGNIGQWCNISFSDYSNPLSYAHYLYIDNELVTNLVIPETVTEIKDRVFQGATCLTSLTIPNSVTSIGDFAFSGCNSITGLLTIPNSVISIGGRAFENCSGFTGSLTIPNSVTSIGYSAFRSCCGFTGSLTIPNSMTSIEGSAFENCTGFTGGLTIPGSVTTIGSSAFSACSNFTSLTIPNSVTEIGAYAFHNCNGFSGSLAIPNSVTYLGYWAFGNCQGFSSITSFAINPPTLEDDTFLNWDTNTPVYISCGLEDAYASQSWGGFSNFIGMCGGSVVVMAYPEEYGTVTGGGLFDAGQPCTVTAMANEGYVFANWIQNGEIASFDAEYTFYVAGDMTLVAQFVEDGNIVFADVNVKNICVSHWDTNGDGELSYAEAAAVSNLGQVFRGNTEITSFEELQYFIGLTTISSYAFSDCNNLTGSLYITNSVTTIGNSAFYNCSGLTAVYYTGDVGQWCNISFYDNPLNYAHNLYIDNELVTNLVIPEMVTEIKNYAFQGATCLTSLTIPNSVTSIGSYAFYNCSGFTGSLTIPNSVTSIGNWAFDGCSGFTGSLTIPNSVTTIGNYAFYNCSGFTGSLTIPNSVVSIGNDAFCGCSGFTGSLTIPNSVVSIGNDAFCECIGFTGSLTIPNSVTTIGDYAFFGCSGLTGNLTISNFVTTIGSYAFCFCSGLTEAILYNSNPPSLGSYAFLYTSFPIYVSYESLNDYKTATNWSDYESRIFPMAYTTVSGYGEGEGNYRFIASPLVENTAPTAVDNMITETAYDLYRFDQSENDEWQNYKYPENTPNFFLANGQGYLYANAEDVNLIFKGEFNEDDTKEVGLAYDANAEFAGWNLVGNPFPVNAYANKSYYTMNEDGTAIEPNTVSSATAIPACTGVMVMAEDEGETVVFSTEAPEAATNQGCLQIELSQAVELVETPTRKQDGPSTGSVTLHDKAIVSFNAGDRLEKFVFNKENAVISIPQGGKELAIACSDKQGEVPLNFKATKNGEYTITIHPEAAELDYLHLIDNLTGADVDLLVSPAYTFTAKTTDYASRFRLVFSGNEADGPSTSSGTFAFISNGNIIITDGPSTGSGACILQIVDVMGRIIVSTDAARNVSTCGIVPGVYVLRLIYGDDVKTQKILVR